MWNSTKAELEENFIALNAKLKREGNRKLKIWVFISSWKKNNKSSLKKMELKCQQEMMNTAYNRKPWKPKVSALKILIKWISSKNDEEKRTITNIKNKKSTTPGSVKPDQLQGQRRSSVATTADRVPVQGSHEPEWLQPAGPLGPGFLQNQLPVGANILWLHSLPWHLPRCAKKLV